MVPGTVVVGRHQAAFVHAIENRPDHQVTQLGDRTLHQMVRRESRTDDKQDGVSYLGNEPGVRE